MAQLSYGINIPAAAYPGQLADSGFHDILSVASGQNAIGYGTVVVTDTVNSGGFDLICGRAPNAAADVTTVGSVLGIAVADQTRTQDPSVNVAQYPAQSAVPCIRQGRVFVYAEGAVTSGTPVFVRVTAGANGSQLGAMRADADGGNAAQLPGAVYRSTTTAAGYACVEVNLV